MVVPQETLVLGPADHGRAVSAEEFAGAFYDEPWRYERVNGKLVVLPPGDDDHANTSEPLRDHLAVYKLTHPDLVARVVSGLWVCIDDSTDRIGDIGVFLQSDQPAPPIPERVPELMFEIVSPGRTSHQRDYVEKRAEYHRFGVLEYVIIDRPARRVTVLTRTPASYIERVLTLADLYTSPLLPGLEIPLAAVF